MPQNRLQNHSLASLFEYQISQERTFNTVKESYRASEKRN
jgi:hypothetical protein